MLAEKKSLFIEIDEKYVDQKKHRMVTYIIGKAQQKKHISFFWRNIKKKIVGRWSQKKKLFPRGGKKKFASNKNSSSPPPPDI